MATIATGYKRFKGLGWVAYDAAWHMMLLITAKQLGPNPWGNVDQYFYAVWLCNQAAQGPACTNCLSCDHTAETCLNTLLPLFGQPNYNQHQAQVKWPPQPLPQFTPTPEPCGLFNAVGGSRCSFNPCKYSHICKACRGNHPASYCPWLSRKRPPQRPQPPNWPPQKVQRPQV